MSLPTLGIIGAGKMGMTLARLARAVDYPVLIAGSGSADKIALSVAVLAPGAVARAAAEVAQQADIVVLALPLSHYRDLPVADLAGKLVIDAMNYWWEIDGPREDLLAAALSTSEMVQQFLDRSRVIKALNHIGYHDLYDDARPHTTADRKAVAIAGGDAADRQMVSELIEQLGFTPLPIGSLDAGHVLEPGYHAFGASLPAAQLAAVIRADLVAPGSRVADSMARAVEVE